ncbi:MAG: alpha/beta hydrolase [Myxococcota bacterium]
MTARATAALGGILLGLVALGCDRGPKRLEYGHYPSRAMHVRMEYAVYTPPDFSPEERLPLVVFLHGGGDGPGTLDRWNVGQVLDRAIAAGELPRLVLVVPDGHNGFWTNWIDGTRNYRDWVLRELLPHVHARYHTQACPEGCHVMGVSMGGAGALGFVLHHPELFAGAGMISAPVFDTDQMRAFADNRWMKIFIPTHRIWGEDPPVRRVRRSDPFFTWRGPEDVNQRLYVAWAEDDRAGVVKTSERLHSHLESRGIAHGHEAFEGGHDWCSWRTAIVRALAYLLDAQ